MRARRLRFCSGLGAVVALGSVVACVVDAPAATHPAAESVTGAIYTDDANAVQNSAAHSQYDVLTQHNDKFARRARRSTRAR